MDSQACREQLLSFSIALWKAAEPADIVALFKERAAEFGFPVFAFGEFDSGQPWRSTMHVVEWPPEWFQLYMRDGLFELDPLLDLVRRGFTPFTWTERKELGGLSRAQIRGFDAAREFGWRGGLTISLPRGGNRFGMLSLAGSDDTHVSAESRATLATMATLAYERLRSFSAINNIRSPYTSGLTDRELDSLAYVACGLSDAGVANKLGISRSTAHEHVESAKRKLGASTRAEAVALAVALGAIIP